MKFCTECGGKLVPGKKYCPSCGTKIELNVIKQEPPKPDEVSPSLQNAENNLAENETELQGSLVTVESFETLADMQEEKSSNSYNRKVTTLSDDTDLSDKVVSTEISPMETEVESTNVEVMTEQTEENGVVEEVTTEELSQSKDSDLNDETENMLQY